MSEHGVPGLAEKLSRLFDRIPGPGGAGLYTSEAAAEELTRRGVDVTGAYISALRSGRRDNPSAKLLAGIANLFGVSVEYFFDEELSRRVTDQLDSLDAARDARLRGLMTRADKISDDGLSHLVSIVDHILKVEGSVRREGDDGGADR